MPYQVFSFLFFFFCCCCFFFVFVCFVLFFSNGYYPRDLIMRKWMTSLSETGLLLKERICLLGCKKDFAVPEANSFFYKCRPLCSVRRFLWEYSGKFIRSATEIQT